MENQTEFMRKQTVNQVIIDPMTRLYQPPAHLRGRENEAGLRDTVAEYQAGLSRYSRHVLEAAWAEVKAEHEAWIWPHLKTIKAACEKRAGSASGGGGSYDSPEKLKIQRATDLWKAAIRDFESSALALRSTAEGWIGDLWPYANAAAWLQAQHIAGVTNVGYSALDLCGPYAPEAEIRRAVQEARNAAAGGGIEITVPQPMIEKWRNHAVMARQKAEGGL